MTCLNEEEIFDYLNNVEEDIHDTKAGDHIAKCPKCRAIYDEIKGIVGAIDHIQTDQAESKEDAKIGKFKLVEVLGEGGMGKVWKAFDPILERYVAIKVMHENVSMSEEAKQRFLAEAKLVAKMNHVNVVQIYSCGYHEDELFIVMEFVDGRPLFTPGVDSIRDPRKAIHYFLQACDGLQAAHEEGIIHRDIKPNNIMIDKKGRIKVLDFGIARSFLIDQEITATGALVGTLKYMAPEVAMGKTATRQSDIYSLGLVLYEMLTGVVAFKDLNPLATLEHIKSKDLEKPSLHNLAITPMIDELIVKMCHRNSTDRFESIMAVKEVVKNILLELSSIPQGMPADPSLPDSKMETQAWTEEMDDSTTRDHDPNIERIFNKKKIMPHEQWEVLQIAMELEKKKQPFFKRKLNRTEDGHIILDKRMVNRAIRQYKNKGRSHRLADLKIELVWIKILLVIILLYILSTYLLD